jgi:hypothetical protein
MNDSTVDILKQKPILFSTEMVQAILSGRKTQTRRIIKPQPTLHEQGFRHPETIAGYYPEYFYVNCHCPYKADTLWVRETWGKAGLETIYKADYLDLHPPMGLVGNWKPSRLQAYLKNRRHSD